MVLDLILLAHSLSSALAGQLIFSLPPH